MVRGRERARLVRVVETEDVRRAEAALTPSAAVDVVASLPLAQAAATAFQAYAKGKEQLEEATAAIAEVVHPGVLADLIAAHAKAGITAKQAVLEMADPVRRLSMAVALIAAPNARAA
jgi:ATP-dependent Lon protease